MDRILGYIKGVTSNALVVFARFPEPGKVKTRLAAALGEGPAAAVYRAFLEDLRRRFARPEHAWTLLWAFEPPEAPFAGEIARGGPAFPQSPGTLGRRMAEAFESALGAGYRSVVLVGSDVPHLSPRVVEWAFARLAGGATLVLGPAEDGGYYLIGARFVPPVFDGIEWGCSSVLGATIERARAAGIEPELAPALYDVDGVGDLERLRRDVESGRFEDLEATRAALETIPAVGYK